MQIFKNNQHLLKLKINNQQIQEIQNIAIGIYSPLKGFLNEADFYSVINRMRLSNGLIWPMPIILDINNKTRQQIKNEKQIILTAQNNKPIALLQNIQIYKYDKNNLAEKVFSTLDKKHPGVAEVYKMNDYLLGGEIKIINQLPKIFPAYNFTPAQTKKIFKQLGWQKIVAFQTRNVPHRGHEFLQLQALKYADGIFIQPVIGPKKNQDFKDEYIISSYQILIDKYYPKNKALLGILPLKMRYAGPREALWHALIRKNFGCTHIIVGRDHAGIGNYYHPFAAQKIFKQFKQKELGIKILKFSEVVFNKKKKVHCFINQCSPKEQIRFSGSQLRTLIKAKEKPPDYLIRPEIYNVLNNSVNLLVDHMYHQQNKNQQGFVLWFTGLSQAGKTTIADKTYQILLNKGYRAERLDGDIVRESLTKDLKFSPKDRDENIKRIGFVANLLSRNNIIVIASFITPYHRQRQKLKKQVHNYIEIFVNTPLQICEQRDSKNLYAQARAGKISNFTGISDPYETPQNPDIEILPAQESVEQCAKKIINYLKQKSLI